MANKNKNIPQLEDRTDLLNNAIKLHLARQQEIIECHNAGYSCLKEIEICFQISARYWAELRKEIVHRGFANKEEEIEFFKRIKPQFMSEIEYYGLCYHGQLYQAASAGHDDLLKFWHRELEREEKFKTENALFYLYYKKGATHHDKKYFTRQKKETGKCPGTKLHDIDEAVATSHDHLVTSIMALEKYTPYVKNELNEIFEK